MTVEFIQPRYDTDGFASLPSQIQDELTSKHFDAVVVFLIDAFGWRFFDRYQGMPFLNKISARGNVRKLTSQFPSTTAAHITTIHTGMPVGEHGIFEWYYYEPLMDAVIAPLLHSYAGTSQRDTLKPTGVKPALLYPVNSLYRSYKAQGLSATIFQHREYTPSTFSDLIYRGARTKGFRTFPEALINLTEDLMESAKPGYYFCYFDRIDGICHEYGPNSPQLEAEIEIFLTGMEQVFMKNLGGNKKRIHFMLTADHGQVESDPQTTIYINRDPAFKGLEKFLKQNRSGELIVPAGSARDFFLHVKNGQIEDARSFLASRLEGRAEVRRISDMLAEGYFGPVISQSLRGRLGDLVILPYKGETVWWYEKDKFEQRFFGHHGGLTPEEMEIPLLTWEM